MRLRKTALVLASLGDPQVCALEDIYDLEDGAPSLSCDLADDKVVVWWEAESATAMAWQTGVQSTIHVVNERASCVQGVA